MAALPPDAAPSQASSLDAHVDFELGEDAPRNREARLRQEATWRSTNVEGRHHFSLREALRVQRPSIENALRDFERVNMLARALRGSDGSKQSTASNLESLSAEALEMIIHFAMPGHAPLFRMLMERGEECKPRGSPPSMFCVATSTKVLVAHDARLARSGRRLTMLHRWYACDGLFGPHVSNQAVNQAVLLPLMRRVISGEGDATILLYGQTGAGKTHTLMGMMEQVASRFDELCGEDAANSRDGVEVVFFELAAAGCCDLLNSRNLITLRADENDQVHARGATTKSVGCGADLFSVLEEALSLRSTLETEANPISSRSHAICSLRIRNGHTLRLVDLAGSERNYETHYMTSRTFKRESAAINESLLALKACFRAASSQRDLAEMGRGAKVRIPYRASMLTRVLRDCFADRSHRTALLAAVAPGASSVLHTFNTLDHVSLMATHLSQSSCEVDVPLNFGFSHSYDGVPVHKWTAEQVLEWLAAAENGRFAYVEVPPGTDGISLLSMNARRLTQLVEEGARAGRGQSQAQQDVAWNLRSGAKIGFALFQALRKCAYPI